MGEKWAAHYGYPPETMRELFLKGFDEVYAGYVLEHFVPESFRDIDECTEN